MNNRTFRIALFLFLFGTCAALALAAGAEAVKRMLGPFAPELAWIHVFWLFCLSAGAVFFNRRPTSRTRPFLFSGLLCLFFSVLMLMCPFILTFAKSLYSGHNGPLIAGSIAALGLGAGYFFLGGLASTASKVMAPGFDNHKRAGRILTACAGGGAAGFYFAPLFLYSTLGMDQTLWMSGAICGFSGFCVIIFARKNARARASYKKEPCPDSIPGISLFWLYVISASTGLILSLSLVVWPRVLNPLFGSYPPALWLAPAMAFFGIGAGAAFFCWRPENAPLTPQSLALALGLCGLFLAIPFAAGDTLAMFAALLRPLGIFGHWGNIIGWGLVTSVISFPASMALGYCFAILPALAQSENPGPAKNIFAMVVAGAGAGLIFCTLESGLGALGWWKVAVGIAGFFCVGMTIFFVRGPGRWPPVFAGFLACALLFSSGPGTIWKHGGIGAGRLETDGLIRNQVHERINQIRRGLRWEAEGKQGFLSIDCQAGLGLVVNGQAEPNARLGVYAQVMTGLTGAALHPEPGRALVLGLGSGVCAGWLSRVDSVIKIDIAEPEPHMLDVARKLAAINANVLENPKTDILNMGFRQAVFCSEKLYDLIVCSPSNPVLSGNAGLYSVEFYHAVKGRLAKGGVFSQHVRTSHANTMAVDVLYASLCSVFGSVLTWQVGPDNLVFVCRVADKPIDLPALRAILTCEPFKKILLHAWGATDAEGFLARFVCTDILGRTVAENALARNWINTDNKPLSDSGFSLARSRPSDFSIIDLRKAARASNQHRPKMTQTPDWNQVDENLLMMFVVNGQEAPYLPGLSNALKQRVAIYNLFFKKDFELFFDFYKKILKDSKYPIDIFASAFALAGLNDPDALNQARKLEQLWPLAAQTCNARYLWGAGRTMEAVSLISPAMENLRQNPWIHPFMVKVTLVMVSQMGKSDVLVAQKLYSQITRPFCAGVLEEKRLHTLFFTACMAGPKYGAAVARQFEPYIPWNYEFLENRQICYRQTQDPRADRAAKDMAAFIRARPWGGAGRSGE